YINSYTTYFPVTREKVLEYVQGSDDFPEGDAESITDELWTVLHDLAAHRNMPPIVYRGWGLQGRRSVYGVRRRNVYLGTAVLCIPVLLVASWLLVGWYTRSIQGQSNARPPDLGTGVAK